MDLVQRILWIDTRVLCRCCRIDLDSLGNCVVQHPAQRNVGKAGFRIASTDVAMHAGEPDLLDNLIRGCRAGPECRFELDTPLIDRHRMIRRVDVGVEAGVQKAVEDFVIRTEDGGDAECANRVPHANHCDLRVVHIGSGKACQQGSAVVFVSIGLECRIHDGLTEIRGRQTGDGDHAGETAGGISAAAEAEDIEPVVLLISMSDFSVSVSDLVPQTCAKRAADEMFNWLGCHTNAIVVIRDLRGAGRQGLEKLVDIGVIGARAGSAVRMVPCAVGAENDVFRHCNSPLSSVSGRQGMR